MKGPAGGRKNHPLATRIKRLMQKDDEVGRIASVTPILIGRALEIFLRKLCTNVIDYAQTRSAMAITPSHLKAYIYSDKMMDFLKDIVKDAPDLPVESSSLNPAPPKRPRSAVDSTPTQRTNTTRRGRGWGAASKRLCIPKANSSEASTSRPSVFASFARRGSQGGSPWRASLASYKSQSLQNSISETKPMSSLERSGRVASLPIKPCAFRATEASSALVDPSTLPIDLQKALLHVPSTEAPPSSIKPISQEIEDTSQKQEMTNSVLNPKKRSLEDTTTTRYLAPSQIRTSVFASEENEKRKTVKAEDDDYDLEDETEDQV